MRINLEQITEKTGKWMDEVLIPNAVSPIAKFKLGFARGILPFKTNEIFCMLKELGGIVGNSNEIDVDTLRECVRNGFCAANSLSISGLTFTQEDADSLFDFIVGKPMNGESAK